MLRDSLRAISSRMAEVQIMKYLPKPYVYIVPETAATQMQLDRIDPFCFCTLPEYPPPPYGISEPTCIG